MPCGHQPSPLRGGAAPLQAPGASACKLRGRGRGERRQGAGLQPPPAAPLPCAPADQCAGCFSPLSAECGAGPVPAHPRAWLRRRPNPLPVHHRPIESTSPFNPCHRWSQINFVPYVPGEPRVCIELGATTQPLAACVHRCRLGRCRPAGKPPTGSSPTTLLFSPWRCDTRPS